MANLSTSSKDKATVKGVLSTVPVNPADGGVYYLGELNVNSLLTTAGVTRMYFPITGRIIAAYVAFRQVAGTSETSTIAIRLNNTTDTTISAAVTNDSGYTIFSNTNLNIAGTAFVDYIEGKWSCPTWVTNPTNVVATMTVIFES